MEVDEAVRAIKLRYLNAMGIESWVRRPRSEAVSSQQGDAQATADAEAAADVVVPVSWASATVIDGMAEEPVPAVRNLLDVEPETVRASVPASMPTPALRLRGEVESEPADPRRPSKPLSQTQVTPEFRLLVLHLAGSILLVDETLLDPAALQADQIQLLGDVLRSARLLVHGDAAGSIEHQVFYWPQVEDAALDQGLPRAREALAYHVRSRLQGGAGPVLHVIPGSGLAASSGAAIVRDSMAEFGATVLEVAAALLDLQAPGRVRAQIWADLCRLEALS